MWRKKRPQKRADDTSAFRWLYHTPCISRAIKSATLFYERCRAGNCCINTRVVFKQPRAKFLRRFTRVKVVHHRFDIFPSQSGESRHRRLVMGSDKERWLGLAEGENGEREKTRERVRPRSVFWEHNAFVRDTSVTIEKKKIKKKKKI